MTKATYRKKSFFGLTVPKSYAFSMADNMTKCDRSRKRKGHIIKFKHESERGKSGSMVWL